MATLREIKKRIESVKSTKQITRAMYMVSAAKLRRAQEAAENSRPYSESLTATLTDLVENVESDNPLLSPREEIKNAELVILTSDRGLCGGYNQNLIKKAQSFMEENQNNFENIYLTCVGKKAADYFKRRKKDIRKTVPNLVREVSFELAKDVADELTERYVQGEIDVVYVVYARFRSALTQVPTVVQLLPVEVPESEEGAEVKLDYIYEPSAKEVLEVLLPRQVRTLMFSAMLEAVASEHGARMTAMDSATNNAEEMIDSLTLQYNRARQAAITTELMEIISGAEALKG